MTRPLSDFTPIPLPPELVADLHRFNPWWYDEPAPPTPSTRRHLVDRVRQLFETDITPVVAVRGPRHVGKTTIQLQIISDLLAEGTPPQNIMRVPYDQISPTDELVNPIIQIARWFEYNITTDRFNALSHQGSRAYLFFDEVQKVDNWSNELKFMVDTVDVKVLVATSSAMLIDRSQGILAGRIYTVDAGPLSLTEIAEFRGMEHLEHFPPENSFGQMRRREFWRELAEHGRQNATARDQAFRLFSERGSYPVAHDPGQGHTDWPTLANLLNENAIRQVLQRDLPTEPRSQGRDAALLERLFELACRYAGQTTTLSQLAQEARPSPNENIGTQEVGNHLQALADTLLIRLVPQTVGHLRPPRDHLKICLADHALRASWMQEQVPLAPEALVTRPELATQAGHIAQSALGAITSNLRDLTTSRTPNPNREPRLDFLFWAGDQQIPTKVQYRRRVDPMRDTEGIRSFVEDPANRAPFGLLITQEDPPPIDDPRVVAMPLSTFMLLA